MQNDDRPVGKVLTRRSAVLLLGSAAGAALFLGCGGSSGNALATLPDTTTGGATGSGTTGSGCVARPQQTEGPYFVDERLNRADIRTDPASGVVAAGAPLLLSVVVANVTDACAPIAAALVDVWHCDALGVYSDIASENTAGKKFLRGYQRTDSKGAARFTTIYPGWYPGRTVHVHFKIRLTTAAGKNYEFTSQLYFDDVLTDQVYTKAPYAAHGIRRTRNSSDGIYRNGGSQLLLNCTPSGSGYAATFIVGLQL